MGTKELEKTNVDELVKLMVGRELKEVYSVDYIKNNKILEVKDFNSKKFNNINFYLKEGEILTFSGLCGSGRTEVARAIFGIDKKVSGEIFIGGKEVKINSPEVAVKAGIGYLPEDRKEQGLYLNMTVSANIGIGILNKLSNFFYVKDRLIDQVAEEYKRKLKIVTPDINQKVINLSGGNQQKIILARWLLINPPIMIVDEPTRGIDVGAKTEIYNILQELVKNGTSLIIISSDLMEVLSISNRIIVMWKGNLVGEIDPKEADEEKIVQLISGITEKTNKNSDDTSILLNN